MALTLTQRIADAEAAYHELVVGRAPKVVVDQNGERVEYTQASRSSLASYIVQLKRERDGASAHSRKPGALWYR